MDFQAKEALKRNKSTSRLWFDLETTGFGKDSKGSLFESPVSIWQIGTNINGNVSETYAEITTPFEKDSLKLFDELENGIPKVYLSKSKVSEEALLKQFGQLIKSNPDAILSGYNIADYDIPLMIKKFKQYGMQEELDIFSKMRVNDVLGKVHAFLDKVIKPIVKDRLQVDYLNGRKEGSKLEVIGKALGIDLSKAPGGEFTPHYAPHDIWLTEEVDKLLRNPAEAAKRYSMLDHAKAVDEATGAANRKGLGSTRVNAEGTYGTRSWVTTLKKLELEGVTEFTNDVPNNPGMFGTKTVAELKDHRNRNVLKRFDKIKSSDAPITAALKEAHDSIKAESQKVIEAAKKIKPADLKNVLKIAAPIAGAFAAIKIASSLKSDNDTTQGYISSSVLGRNNEQIEQAIAKASSAKAFNKSFDSTISKGDTLKRNKQVKEMLEDEIKNTSIGYDSNVKVEDDELGIKGNIDVVAEIDDKKIPIQVKTTSSQNLRNMEEPENADASQVNFYSHALGSPGGYVMYVSSDDPKDRRSFYVPYSSSRLIRDVADFREVLIKNRNEPGVAGAWGKQLEGFNNNYVPDGSQYNMNMMTHRSKLRDQATRTSHLFPGTPNGGNTQSNGSHYNRRN